MQDMMRSRVVGVIYLTITTLVMLAATIKLSGFRFYSGISFPQCGQNFTPWETARPQLVQTLVTGAAAGLGGPCFSFLTMRYIINPRMPVMITIISHSAPLIPLDSASLYTQTQSSIAMMNQTIGIMQKRPASPHSHCPIGIGIIFLHLDTLFQMTLFIKLTFNAPTIIKNKFFMQFC